MPVLFAGEESSHDLLVAMSMVAFLVPSNMTKLSL